MIALVTIQLLGGGGGSYFSLCGVLVLEFMVLRVTELVLIW